MKHPLELPYVLMNMAMSVDGKISTRHRESITLGTSQDRLLMDKIRAQVDAVIIGSGTLKADGFPLLVRNAEIRRWRTDRGLPSHPVNVLLSRTLDIPARKKFFSHPESKKIVYTSRLAEPAQRRKFEKYAEVVLVPARISYLKYVLTDLANRGFKKVLLEGGGELNYSFFHAGLVNEIYLTITPRIIGGGKAPTVVDGKGFLKHNHIELKLRSVKRIGDELFLRYMVE
jgi:riboflavin-specific deaminase-like protein